MPALFALNQHGALVAAQSMMHPSAKLMAFQDDVYVVSSPTQVAACYTHLERELWAHAGIRINLGKTQIFNRAGRQLTPPVVVWREDSALPPDKRGVTILGTLLGHLEFVKAQLRAKAEEHRILLNRVQASSDLQCAWLILSFCCVTGANYYLFEQKQMATESFRRCGEQLGPVDLAHIRAP